jgi:hypothetical protein
MGKKRLINPKAYCGVRKSVTGGLFLDTKTLGICWDVCNKKITELSNKNHMEYKKYPVIEITEVKIISIKEF